MHKFLLAFTCCLILTVSISAQRSVWDGGVDGLGTDWGTAENWVGDVLPASGDSIVFNSVTVTVSGTALPIRNLNISGGAIVSLGLSLTSGDGSADAHALQIGANCQLTLIGGNTLTLNPGATRNGIQIGTTATAAAMIVQSGATVSISGGNHGINFSGPGASIMMMGDMTITGTAANGIRQTDGTFENRGGLTIAGAGTNGIESDAIFTNVQTSTTVLTITDAVTCGIKIKANGTFTNDKDVIISGGGVTSDGINSLGTLTNLDNSADIIISGTTDDGIEAAGGTFDNGGFISVELAAGLMSGNSGITVGDGVTFNNTSSNTLTTTGAASSGRAIIIAATGTLNNTGEIMLAGGDDANRINNSGTLLNANSSVIDLTDGRINTSGTLTNNGFITTTRTSSGVFNTGTATNNAFFGYGSGSFASGSGTATDLGININQFSSRTIDAMGDCTVKIANESYTYTYGGTPVGTSDATGNFMFDDNSLDQETVNIKPVGLPSEIMVRIQNVCSVALPVELTTLEAVAMPKSVMIKWSTASEEDNDYMAVERSQDGSSFVEIGRVNGVGNTFATNNYELEDNAPANGTNYYRLRQVDFGGEATYSHVVTADFAGATNENLRVFPTVLSAGEQLRVDVRNQTEAASGVYSIVDASGRRLSSVQLATGSIAEVNVGHLRAGTYYLVTNFAGQPTSARFIIK